MFIINFVQTSYLLIVRFWIEHAMTITAISEAVNKLIWQLNFCNSIGQLNITQISKLWNKYHYRHIFSNILFITQHFINVYLALIQAKIVNDRLLTMRY